MNTVSHGFLSFSETPCVIVSNSLRVKVAEGLLKYFISMDLADDGAVPGRVGSDIEDCSPEVDLGMFGRCAG